MAKWEFEKAEGRGKSKRVIANFTIDETPPEREALQWAIENEVFTMADIAVKIRAKMPHAKGTINKTWKEIQALLTTKQTSSVGKRVLSGDVSGLTDAQAETLLAALQAKMAQK